jgi:hypothetical protein
LWRDSGEFASGMPVSHVSAVVKKFDIETSFEKPSVHIPFDIILINLFGLAQVSPTLKEGERERIFAKIIQQQRRLLKDASNQREKKAAASCVGRAKR